MNIGSDLFWSLQTMHSSRSPSSSHCTIPSPHTIPFSYKHCKKKNLTGKGKPPLIDVIGKSRSTKSVGFVKYVKDSFLAGSFQKETWNLKKKKKKNSAETRQITWMQSYINRTQSTVRKTRKNKRLHPMVRLRLVRIRNISISNSEPDPAPEPHPVPDPAF